MMHTVDSAMQYDMCTMNNSCHLGICMCTCVEVVVLCGGNTFMCAMHNILTIHIVYTLHNMHYTFEG